MESKEAEWFSHTLHSTKCVSDFFNFYYDFSVRCPASKISESRAMRPKTLSKHLGHSNSHDDTIAEKTTLISGRLIYVRANEDRVLLFSHIMGEYCVPIMETLYKMEIANRYKIT